MRLNFPFLAVLIFLNQCAFSQCTLDFKNKYLVYSPTIKSKENFLADFFYINKDDTIVKVNTAFGHWENVVIAVDTPDKNGMYSTSARMPKEAEFPYKVHIKGNTVYFKYYPVNYSGDSVILLKMYSLKKADTCKISASSYKWMPHYRLSSEDVTVNTGIDTTIMVNNNKIECTKFLQYNSGYRGEAFEKYLDKKYFLPVLVKKYYKDLENKWTYLESYILRYTLNMDEVQTAEYTSPYHR